MNLANDIGVSRSGTGSVGGCYHDLAGHSKGSGCETAVILKPTDILLWRVSPGSNWIDRLVGWGERFTSQVNSNQVNYYHVAMVGVDPLHYYDSAPGGVKNSLIPIPLPPNIEVYRFIMPIGDLQQKAMWTYANSQLGTGYNYVGVFSAGLIEVLGKPFCSELVWRMGTYAGVVVCPWKTCLSPDDIAASPILKRVS